MWRARLKHKRRPLLVYFAWLGERDVTVSGMTRSVSMEGALLWSSPARVHQSLKLRNDEAPSISLRNPWDKEHGPLPDETAWLKQIAHLEAQVASLQQQLASLRSLASPVTLSGPVQQGVQTDRKIASVDGTTDGRRHRGWTPHPAESRRHPVLPLIAYGATGSYVVICPHEGELSLLPDSASWFAWLASLSSFRFVGRSGRMSVSRVCDHGPKRTWYAYRTIHQHDYKHYLGTTDHLTIDVLEQMAARLQSYVDAF